MNPLLKNILAIIIGWFGGSIINMGLVQAGHAIFPIKGIDPSDMDALAKILPSLDFEYFIFPFLAHAIGTLVGAVIAFKLAASHPMRMALMVGVLFLIGGIIVNYLLQGPTWFAVVDILIAYIPMAWIGGRIVEKLSKK